MDENLSLKKKAMLYDKFSVCMMPATKYIQ